MKNILLLIPTYNCEKQIARVIEKTRQLNLHNIAEVLVVDNGSVDQTREVAIDKLKEFSQIKTKLVLNDSNYSLGGSLKVGIQYAATHRYEFLLVLHGDDQAELCDILPYIEDGTAMRGDLFIGARFHPQSKFKGYSSMRIWGNKFLDFVLQLIVRRPIQDLIAGINLYRMSIFSDGLYRFFPNDLTFDAHLLLYALHKKFNIQYFPITWVEEDQVSNARVFKQGWSVLKLFMSYLLRGELVFDELKVRGSLETPVYSYTTKYSRELDHV